MEISDDKIQLFIRIATKFAINFPDKKNRIKAIKWIKKIQDEKNSNTKQIKFHAIQLLLCCLQRNLLVGPFENTPNDKIPLKQYSWSYQPNDIAKLILEHEFDKCGKPPIKIEISGDLTEFVSYQEIPNFGAHFFYAYSPEDIKKWDNLDKSVIPKGLININEFESPDNSILVKSIQENYEKRQESKKKVSKKRIEQDERTQQDFQDVTIIDENTAKIRDSFIDQVPVVKDAAPTDTLKEVIGSGMVKHDDIAVDPTIAKEGVKIKGPHVEKITVTKDGKKVIQKKKVKKVASKQEATKLEDEIKELERKRDAEKQAMLKKMPAKLRERLQRQYAPTQEEKDLRTPEIFRKTQTRHPGKKYRIYKPQEFGLKPDEKFVPATEFVKGLKYKPPTKKIRRSPIPREAYSKTLHFGSRQPGPLISLGKRKQDETTDDTSPLSKDVRLSWERSWEKRKKSRLEKPQIPSVQQETPRRDILERLEAIKRLQPRRIDFDEDVDVTPVEVDYEPFVYQELPESDYEPSILSEDQMQTEDVFGEGATAYPYKIPAGPPVQIFEEDDILHEEEMQTDDLFPGENIIDPRMLKKGSQMDRIISHLPTEQIDDIVFDESPHGAEPMSNRLLDRRPQQMASIQYGPWAERFRRQMERLERGESSIESDEGSSLLQEDEMELGDMFEPGTPEIVQRTRQEKLAEQIKRMQNLKRRWLTYKERLKREPRPLEADEDLLEPVFYRTPVYEPPGLMDSSIVASELIGLQAPLISGVDFAKKNLLEEYEEQLNNSLKLLYGQIDMPPKMEQRVKVFEDPDFLERRIFEIPAETSIISESEMAEDAFGEFIDEESSIEEDVYIEDESFPSMIDTTPIRSIQHADRKLHFHLLPDERLEDISMPDDELAMSAALLETEMEEDEVAETEQRVGRNIGADLKRLKERMQVVREQRLQRERPPVARKKPAKVYRGPMWSPGSPGVPGTSNLRGVQWESFEKHTEGTPTRMKILEQALEEEVNRKILQEQMDAFGSTGDSLIDVAEMEDLFGEDEIAEPIPMHKIPMPTRTPPSRVQPYYDTITEKLDDQSLPSEIDTLESDSMIEDYDQSELLEDESFPSESMAYLEVEPLSDADIQAAKWDYLRKIRQRRSDRRRKIGLSPIAEVQDEEDGFHPSSHFDANTRRAFERSILASKRLQQLRQKLRERKGLPPIDEEEIKDALQELHERQRIIDNMGLMDEEIQEKITQRPLIEEPTVIKPLNVIEEYDRDMKFIAKARELYKRRRDIEKEAAKIAEDIEKDAILAQQEKDEIIKDIEDLDWEVEEPVPVSKLPMPHIEEETGEPEDLEQVSIPEDISYESAEEDEVPVYTREQFEREFEEEQRQKRELESILAQQTVVDSSVQQPLQRQVQRADRPEVSEAARKKWDKLRQIRQRKNDRRRRIGLSPIQEVSHEEDLGQMSDLMEKMDESHESYGEDPFASFEANIDYYIVQELGDKLYAQAPPLTAAEMPDFDEEDVERPPPMHMIPMPQRSPEKDYFTKMEQIFEEDLVDEISEPEEMEEADEFYGATDEYGRPLSPTRITLAKNIRQSMVTTDLIHRYRRMKGLPLIDNFPKLPYIHQYLEHEQDLLEPMTPGVVEIEETLLDESLPETELPPALVGLPKAPMNVIEEYEQKLGKYPRLQQFSPESPDILSESVLDETFGETATPTRMKDIPMPSPRTPPRRIAQSIQSSSTTPRRPQRSSPYRRPANLEERFDFISQVAMPQRHELVGVRPHEYAPLQFFERPVAEELDFLEAETFPDENLPIEMEDTEFGDLYRAVFIPTEAEEREIAEALARQRISPPSRAPQPRSSYRQTAVAGSPIGKTWISPGEESFKWLDNYIPSEELKARKAKKARKVTFAAEPHQAYFEPFASASATHVFQPPRVAGLVNPRLARAKEQSRPIPQGPRKISKKPPRVAFLQHPRTTRAETPQPLPIVPKKILRAPSRVASLPPRRQSIPNTRPSQPLPPSMSTRRLPGTSSQTGAVRKKKVIFKE